MSRLLHPIKALVQVAEKKPRKAPPVDEHSIYYWFVSVVVQLNTDVANGRDVSNEIAEVVWRFKLIAPGAQLGGATCNDAWRRGRRWRRCRRRLASGRCAGRDARGCRPSRRSGRRRARVAWRRAGHQRA